VTDINVKVDRIVHLASILGFISSCLPRSYHQPLGGGGGDLMTFLT
jgi:hypothetical protein